VALEMFLRLIMMLDCSVGQWCWV